MTVQIQNPGKSGLIAEFVDSVLLSLVRGSGVLAPMTGKQGLGGFQRLDTSGVDNMAVVSRLQNGYSAGQSG